MEAGDYLICGSCECPALITRCIAGDEIAWSQLIKIHSRRIRGFIRKTLKYAEADRHEDIEQETYRRIFTALKALRTGSTLCRFVEVVAVNTARDAGRRLKSRRTFGDRSLIPDDHPSPIDLTEAQVSEFVEEGLRGLDSETVIAFRLHYMEGMPPKQIGDRLGKSVRRIQELIAEARKHLKALLRDPDGNTGHAYKGRPSGNKNQEKN